MSSSHRRKGDDSDALATLNFYTHREELDYVLCTYVQSRRQTLLLLLVRTVFCIVVYVVLPFILLHPFSRANAE